MSEKSNRINLIIDIENKGVLFAIFESKWYSWSTYEYKWEWKAEVTFIKN